MPRLAGVPLPKPNRTLTLATGGAYPARRGQAQRRSGLVEEKDQARAICRAIARCVGTGTLDAHAFVAQGLLDLHEATHDLRWLSEAIALQRVLAGPSPGYAGLDGARPPDLR